MGKRANMEITKIPLELRDRRQWVLHRNKQPFQPTGERASTTNAASWSGFDDAANADGQFDGPGFVFSNDDPFVGVDLDRCRDAATGKIEPWAQDIVNRLDSYAEVSPSGNGIHIIAKGRLPIDGSGVKRDHANGKAEAYQHSRYFTVTGDSLNGLAIKHSQAALDSLWAELFANVASSSKVNKPEPDPETNATAQEIEQCRAALAELPEAIEGHRGSDATIRAACEIRRHQIFGEQGYELLQWFNVERCTPPWSESELQRKWAEAAKFELNAASEFGEVETDEPERIPKPLHQFATTDIGNGERFAYRNKGRALYVSEWESWLYWNGKFWEPNARERIAGLAKATARAIVDEAQAETDGDRRQAILKHAISSERRDRLSAMIEMAKSEQGMSVQVENLDAKPWLLNCTNGTVDLKTGRLQPHNPGDLLTKTTGVQAIETMAEGSEWAKCIETVFDGNAELIGFVQRLFGYALVGQVSEHILAVFHGDGANGKSTIVETAMRALGEYALKAPQGLLMAKRHEAHPTELADLQGRRLVVVTETEQGKRLNEPLTKELTGGDTVRARRMRENFFQFEPSHTAVLVSNYRPDVTGTDNGIWRRLRLVPFSVTIPVENQDANLPERLRGQLPVVLRWMVEGCLAWQREGLNPPSIVMAATNAYRADSDPFLRWFEERIDEGDSYEVTSSEAFNDYCQWCSDGGELAASRRAFGIRLRQRPGVGTKRTSQRLYTGCRLAPENDATDGTDAYVR